VYKKIVVLTGAGISQESGLKTFRGSDGLWEGHRIEEVASPVGFENDPLMVWDFYNQRRRQLLCDEVDYNNAHKSLAEFEKNFCGDFLLVTQNVDDLHERSGSQNVLHMHGELLKARCLDTSRVYDWTEDLGEKTSHPDFPEKVGRLRPHIVWFGEMPLHMDKISQALKQCDLFISIGTSAQVYPAAGFVSMTSRSCHRVELNLEDTPSSMIFDETHRGLATEVVSNYFKDLLS
jgi:NAD-dependent deacetylase